MYTGQYDQRIFQTLQSIESKLSYFSQQFDLFHTHWVEFKSDFFDFLPVLIGCIILFLGVRLAIDLFFPKGVK